MTAQSKAVVLRPTARRVAIVRATSLLTWCLLLLLLVTGIAMSGRTVPRTPGGQGAGDRIEQGTSVPWHCVRVGHDSCYQLTSANQHTASQGKCVRVGHDSCYQVISSW